MKEAEEIFSKINAKELWSHVVYFSHITRVSGSENERVACEYVRKTLEKYGVPVEIYEFPSLLSYPLKAKLRVLTPEYKDIESITHSFSASTSIKGIEGEICYVGSGKTEEYGKASVKNMIALVDGLVSPLLVRLAEDHGAIGQIHISGEDVMHEMAVAMSWGTPTPESLEKLPRIPVISVRKSDGDYLKKLCAAGSVRVHLFTKIWTGWKKVRIPVATIRGNGSEADRYVIVGGHYDSWYEGTTDNATGNAACLELARLFASIPKGVLKRSIKIAWWPGHSTGMYSGSTWFVDNQWKDLSRNAIAYLNVDSLGCVGATTYVLESTAELRDYSAKIIIETTGLQLKIALPRRRAEESFQGLGIPSVNLRSMLPENGRATGIDGSGGGWWWHTKYDTIDKANISVLIRDLKVLLFHTFGLCSFPILPFDFSRTADEILETLNNLQKGEKFDLTDIICDAKEFKEISKECESVMSKVLSAYEKLDKPEEDVEMYEKLFNTINKYLMKICRLVNPVLYTESGRYGQDPAFDKPLIPSLQSIPELLQMKEESGEFRFLKTKLCREKNKVSDAISLATEHLKELLTVIEEKMR